MNEYEKKGILKKFTTSVYNFKGYNYFISEKLSKAVIYLLILVLISSSLMIFKKGLSFKNDFTNLKAVLTDEMPPFTLENGQLIIDSEMPIDFETENDNSSIIIIDTTNKFDKTNLHNYDNWIFVGKQDLTVKELSGKTTTLEYSSLQLNDVLTSEKLTSIINTFSAIFIVIVLIFIFIFSFIGKSISVFAIMPLAALIISSILNKKLSYSNLVKISSYALTVPILVKTLLNLIGVTIPMFFLLYYGIGIFYLTFALKNINIDHNINKNLDL